MEGRYFGIVNKLIPIGIILLITACVHLEMDISTRHCDGNNEEFIYRNNILRESRCDNDVVIYKYKKGKIKHIILNKEKDSPMVKIYYAQCEVKRIFEEFGIFIEYPEAFFDHVYLAHLMGVFDPFSRNEIWRDSITNDNNRIFFSKMDANVTFPTAEFGHVDSVSFVVKDSCLMQWAYLWDHNDTGLKELNRYEYQYDNKKRVKSIKIYTQTQADKDTCVQYFYYLNRRDVNRRNRKNWRAQRDCPAVS